MIIPTFKNAVITKYPGGKKKDWIVVHPTNDIVLCFCDSKKEAVKFRDALNEFAKQIRDLGLKEE